MTFLCGLDGNQFATRIELDACTHERKGRVMKRCDCELIDNGSGKPVAKSLAFTMFDAGFVPGEKTTTVLTADLAALEARLAKYEAALREAGDDACDDGICSSYDREGWCASCIAREALASPPTQSDGGGDVQPREPGCQCHREVGDSPCRVHGDETVPGAGGGG